MTSGLTLINISFHIEVINHDNGHFMHLISQSEEWQSFSVIELRQYVIHSNSSLG